ncbi:MAG: SMC-Scp complex subunit ScpB [Candidatus Omnitrophica bacterium]|nr:SMC-Scp complex subunit ScpB [Candidatus Omnitrophota bacterium]
MSDILDSEKIKSELESLIFVNNKPLLLEDLKKVFPNLETSDIRQLIETLKREYEERSSGIRIVEIAGGFQMVTAPECADIIKEFYKIKHTEKLTGPSLEALAIIAYKQPVTRIDIEAVRGVNCDGVVKSLLEKNLIRIVGRKEVIGRPFVYGTTRFFLDYFGLKSLNELPKIEEFAQQDMLKNMQLASGEAEITPLSSEEEQSLSLESQGDDRPADPAETQDEKPADPGETMQETEPSILKETSDGHQ